ncbi:hypothetical protein [Hymenobacter cavernae]|uniref:DUF1851 domain-containing protein n=1 Tax=Hymenobacter cavernae TaxID=2044852 RepID=A0ABQ1USC6_9BACT|nr:hypothetical protein [Hymenobacter cavernae]GGF23961.1 hypothetical protein GCM10011383_39540 [Hymenobacter cavernae]
MNKDIYPKWLGKHILNDSFSWDKSTRTTFPVLLEQITLHDSQWYTTFFEMDNSLVMVIELDAVWNKEFCYNSEEWPFLIIRFNNVLCTFSNFNRDDYPVKTISSAETSIIDNIKFNSWYNSAKDLGILSKPFYERDSKNIIIHRTEIDTIYSGTSTFFHAVLIETLFYSNMGQLLPIQLP